MLKKIHQNIWVEEQPFSILKYNFGCRMIVICDESNSLTLISPTRISEALTKQIEALGSVKLIISTNTFHHLFIAPWSEKYPSAKVVAPEPVKKKQPDLKISQAFSPTTNLELPSVIEYILVDGGKRFYELVLFHRVSQTLILTDLIFNLKSPSGIKKIFAKLFGITHPPCSSRMMRMLFTPSEKARGQLKEISEWDFSRVIMAHGDIITSDAKKKFINAMAWV
jgi:hypothetical protein